MNIPKDEYIQGKEKKKQTPAVKLDQAVKSELDRLKIAEGETYQGVIKRLIKGDKE